MTDTNRYEPLIARFSDQLSAEIQDVPGQLDEKERLPALTPRLAATRIKPWYDLAIVPKNDNTQTRKRRKRRLSWITSRVLSRLVNENVLFEPVEIDLSHLRVPAVFRKGSALSGPIWSKQEEVLPAPVYDRIVGKYSPKHYVRIFEELRPAVGQVDVQPVFIKTGIEKRYRNKAALGPKPRVSLYRLEQLLNQSLIYMSLFTPERELTNWEPYRHRFRDLDRRVVINCFTGVGIDGRRWEIVSGYELGGKVAREQFNPIFECIKKLEWDVEIW